MFRIAVGLWEIAPSEFWRMTMREYWWLYDMRKPPEPKVGRSSFTVSEVEAIAERLRAEKAEKERRKAEEANGDG